MTAAREAFRLLAVAVFSGVSVVAAGQLLHMPPPLALLVGAGAVLAAGGLKHRLQAAFAAERVLVDAVIPAQRRGER